MAKTVRLFLVLVATVAALSIGCRSSSRAPTSMTDLVLLTRDGCPNTATMRARLDQALNALELSTDYRVLDLDSAAADDPRGGYPTPTVLYKGRDLFGMSEPALPHPEPT
jgi:hypothetical protein